MNIINRTVILITMFLVFCGLPAAAGVPGNSVEDKLIKSVEVEGLVRTDHEEMLALIPFRAGDLLDAEEVKISIRRIFRKGTFLDVRVISDPYDGGIKLKYVVEEIPLINRIRVKGNRNIRAGVIKKVFIMKEGEDYRDEFLKKAGSGLMGFYRKKGFHDVRVNITAVDTENASEVDIDINIEEGPPYIIEKINMPEDDRKYLRLREGGMLDMDVLDRGIERIRNHYKEKRHVRPVVGPYEIKNSVLTIPVKPGPKLKLYFKGNSRVSSSRLEEEVSFLEDEEVSEDIIKEVVENIKVFYLSKGYYYVQVAAGLEASEDTIKVSFYIFEGERVKLTKIDFKGINISPESLKGILPLKEGEVYNENLLDASSEALTGFYNALGYINADLTDVLKKFDAEGRELMLEFVINEGLQTRIREIRIEGNNDIDTARIKQALQLEEGSPYNLIDIGDARYRVLSLYGSSGYADALVDVETRVDGENAFLVFKIVENRPSVIGKIIVSGNRQTRTEVITREFNIKEGDLYNYDDILRVRQRLYGLGLFNEVSTEMIDTHRETEGRHVRDVLVSLKEGKSGSVEIGIGYGDYEKFRGSFDITYRNIGGYNRQIGLRTEASSVEERIVLNYREPHFFDLPGVPLDVFLVKERKRAVNLDTDEVLYKIDRYSLVFSTEKKLLKGLKAGLSYEYSQVDTKDVEPGVILGREDLGRLAIGSVSPSLFYDTRDDPFNPTSGSLNGVIVKIANEVLLSETEFVKAIGQSSWFTELTKGLVLALSVRGGAAYSYEEDEELPLVERFFLGGRTTVRGYSQDTLGPKSDEGTPTGGNMFVLGNAELRVSPGKGFGFVIFIDGGNVWQVARDTQAKAKFTTGVGLRYNTPVGPVRIDYGHKLERMEGESEGEVHFSFGHAF